MLYCRHVAGLLGLFKESRDALQNQRFQISKYILFASCTPLCAPDEHLRGAHQCVNFPAGFMRERGEIQSVRYLCQDSVFLSLCIWYGSPGDSLWTHASAAEPETHCSMAIRVQSRMCCASESESPKCMQPWRPMESQQMKCEAYPAMKIMQAYRPS